MWTLVLAIVLSVGNAGTGTRSAEATNPDYAAALTKSILFFEAQRSGKLPATQRIKWRSDSGLKDGHEDGVDLVGGYYDAGDNVKFGLPMAHTITMLSWSTIEYESPLRRSGQLGFAMDAIKWGTDYLLKAHVKPFVLYGQVGDGDSDHECWQRPEDMNTSRKAYKIDVNNPGSELAGETSAAMAAASIAFRYSDPFYSKKLVAHSKQLFQFADNFRGKYDNSIPVAKKYYGTYSGYNDELLWAATWLYKATGKEMYLDYLTANWNKLGGATQARLSFCWDDKFVGVQVLSAQMFMQKRKAHNQPVLQKYQQQAEIFMCSCLQQGANNVQRTPGGLLRFQKWNNMHFVTSASFLLAVYSDYLTASGRKLQCENELVDPSQLLALAKSQVDYILGNNPRGISYMVGYGPNYPQRVHHRASSIVSYNVNNSFVGCRGGYSDWFERQERDPNVLVGALVGGPDQNDNYVDSRDNYQQAEPTTYNNSPMVGILARLLQGSRPGGVLEQLGLARNSQDNFVMIKQSMTDWSETDGKKIYSYAGSICNKSSKKVSKLEISISKLYGTIEGLKKQSNGLYGLPKSLNSLASHQTINFTYVQSAPRAVISVVRYHLS